MVTDLGHARSAVIKEWAAGRLRSEIDLLAFCSAKMPVRGIAPHLWPALQTATSALESRANAQALAKRKQTPTKLRELA